MTHETCTSTVVVGVTDSFTHPDLTLYVMLDDH